MIVCHCLVVNDAAVVEAVEAGATTLAKVCQATGAGTDCGSCVFSVKALLCQHDVSRTPLSPQVPVAVSEPDLSDHGTAAVFEEMVRDEQKHVDWFEAQPDAVAGVGLPQYLAQQMDPVAGL